MKTKADRDAEAQEQYNSIARMMGRIRDFKHEGFYFWVEKGHESRGICYNSIDGECVAFTVSIEHETFDIWTDGHFVDYGPEFMNEYMSWLDDKLDQELLDSHDIDIPKYFRNKMESKLEDRLVESMFSDGCDYDIVRSGHSFEGLENMKNKQILEMYEMYFDSEDELLIEVKSHLAVEEILC